MEQTNARNGYVGRLLRHDEDDDEERRRTVAEAKETPKDDEGHGNTRLPYGLCKEAGIDTTGMKPRQAWDALREKYGISPTDAFEWIDERGSSDGLLDGKKSLEDTHKATGLEKTDCRQAREKALNGLTEAERGDVKSILDTIDKYLDEAEKDPQAAFASADKIIEGAKSTDGKRFNNEFVKAVASAFDAVKDCNTTMMLWQLEQFSIKEGTWSQMGEAFQKGIESNTESTLKKLEGLDDRFGDIKDRVEKLLDAVPSAEEFTRQAKIANEEHTKKKQGIRSGQHFGSREIRNCAPDFKTTEEAENYIKKEIGVDNVNLRDVTDITPEICKDIVDVFASMYENYGIKPKCINVDKTQPQNNDAYWMPAMKIFAFSHTENLKTGERWDVYPKKIKQQLEKNRDYFEERIRTAKKQGYKKSIIAQYEESLDLTNKRIVTFDEDFERPYNFLLDGKEWTCLVTHEMGHCLSTSAQEMLAKEQGKHSYSDLESVPWEDDLLMEVKTHGDGGRLSGYAMTAPVECFAECFAMYTMGVKLPDYIVERIEQARKYAMKNTTE